MTDWARRNHSRRLAGKAESVQKRVLITDVDNTLLDWQGLWYQTFSAMIGKVIEISGVDSETLYAECSTIHQKYGTSEYSRLLEELPCLHALYGEDVLKVMAPAVDTFRDVRRRVLQLYPTVEETLMALKSAGVVIAAFTESKAFYTNYRFRKLGLDGLIDYLYSPADHSMPDDTLATATTSQTATISKGRSTASPQRARSSQTQTSYSKSFRIWARQSRRQFMSATIFSRTCSWRSRPASLMFTHSMALASTNLNMSFCAK